MPATPQGASSPSPDGALPLPDHPNLELERKRAKRLLRALRSGDPAALQRAGRLRLEPAAPADFKLADAHFLIAREYAFASWPRLVEYYGAWRRHALAGPRLGFETVTQAERMVERLLAGHRARRPWAVRMLATFVPRLYGRTDEEALAAEPTLDEARLAAARLFRFSSWEALRAAGATIPDDWDEFKRTPRIRAIEMIRAEDLGALEALVDEHPELLRASAPEDARDPVIRSALLAERRSRTAGARRITDWLASRGADLSGALNRMLAAGPNVLPEDVAYLLERGADPAWTAPNGMTVIEHALLVYWSPAAVDLIATRVTPRRAFWICAGLGDLRGTLSYLDREGRPGEAARRDRPDFLAAGLPGPSPRPGVDDLEILWEAFFVAGINRRFGVLDALLDRGLPVDHAPRGNTMLEFAEGNRMTDLGEFLIARGAQPKTA